MNQNQIYSSEPLLKFSLAKINSISYNKALHRIYCLTNDGSLGQYTLSHESGILLLLILYGYLNNL